MYFLISTNHCVCFLLQLIRLAVHSKLNIVVNVGVNGSELSICGQLTDWLTIQAVGAETAEIGSNSSMKRKKLNTTSQITEGQKYL